MVDINSNKSGGGTPPGTPNNRAAKKQNTKETPEKMKKNQQELMEIDSSEGSSERTAPRSPPRSKKDSEARRDIDDMVIDLDSPPSTPGRKGNKATKPKGLSPKRKPDNVSRVVLSQRQKKTLAKWPRRHSRQRPYLEKAILFMKQKRSLRTKSRMSKDAPKCHNTRSS